MRWRNVGVTFSERMNPATITTATVELRTASNALVTATVSYNDLTRTATLDPTGPLENLTTYTATVKGGAAGVTDLAGNPLAADVSGRSRPARRWRVPARSGPPLRRPRSPPTAFADAIELGVKWRAEVDGFVTGLRFYKGPGNTGPHIGNLWTSTGTLLGSVTFTGETASGWQQVTLPTPVAVLANTTYVASYHTTTGHFSVTENHFTAAGVDTPPLHALANGVAGGNGVFIAERDERVPDPVVSTRAITGSTSCSTPWPGATTRRPFPTSPTRRRPRTRRPRRSASRSAMSRQRRRR